jgi:simple sugar transport system permease protein
VLAMIYQRHTGRPDRGHRGAYLTVGSVGTFSKDMSSGLGYIALAAMIFGR